MPIGNKRNERDPLVPPPPLVDEKGVVPPPPPPPANDGAAMPLKWLVAIIVLEGVLSLSINLYNSWLLRYLPGFKFPLIYTEVHMLTSFVGAGILIRCFRAAPLNLEQARAVGGKIALLALLRGISISANNYSLRYISLGLNKVIKASVPIFTVLTSVLCEGKTYSPYKVGALLLLAMGTMVSCIEPGTIDLEHMGGILLAGTSAAVGGASIVCTSLLLGKGSGLGPINLLFYFSPIQAAMLSLTLPAELPGFLSFAHEHEVSVWLYVFAGAALAFAFNMAAFLLVQSTSSLTAAMLGNVKIVLIIVLSEVGAALLGRSRLNIFNVLGYTVTILAGALYTAINLHERGQLQGATHMLGAAQHAVGRVRQCVLALARSLRSASVAGGARASGDRGPVVGGYSSIGHGR